MSDVESARARAEFELNEDGTLDFELEATGRILPELQMSLGYTLQDAVITELRARLSEMRERVTFLERLTEHQAGVILELGGHRESTFTRSDLIVLRRSRMPRISVRSGWNFASICCIATITRAMPCFSWLNADESMMATFVAAGAGRVCVCARIVNAANATAATIMRNAFIT